jgi:hypothetical protein
VGATGLQGLRGPQGPAGPQGERGADGTVAFDELTEAQKASLKGETGAQGPAGPRGETGAQGPQGRPGASGTDGYSPTAIVEQTSTGAKITITDKNGTTTATVNHGKDGEGGGGGGITSETDPVYTADKPNLALKSEIPTKVSQLTNDSKYLTSIPSEYVTETELNGKGYLTSYTETDPKYTADKDKLALKTEIPTKVSQLTNDSKYLTSYTETDPTVPSWAKATTKPSYTKSEVGLGNVDNVKQYSDSNPPPYPVTSVNGKTGAITVTVPTKTSELTNDSGFTTTTDLDNYIEENKEELRGPAGKDGTVGGEITPETLKPYQSDYLDTLNLYNQDTNTDGYIINASGVVTANSSYSLTDYVYMPAGTYCISQFNGRNYTFVYFALFNPSTKEFVVRRTVEDTDAPNGNMMYRIIEFESDYLVRWMGSKTWIKGNSIMLTKGSSLPTEYKAYGLAFKHPAPVDPTTIEHNAIRKEQTDFIKQSTTNFINHMTINRGYYYDTVGNIKESNQYGLTEKIYLKPKTKYSMANIHRVTFFDKNGNWLGITSDGQTTFTMLDNAFYIIANVNIITPTLQNWQISEGDTLPPYKKHYLTIDGFRIYDDVDKYASETDKIRNWDRVVYDQVPVFTLSTEKSAINKSTELSSSAVYNKYDTLMARHPKYITKTSLGTASDGTTLYRYDFKEPEQVHAAATPYSKIKPKLILISGVHPEFGGIYSLYGAMEEIADNPELIELRRNSHFIVIPIINSYGCDGNGDGRRNINNIDLARNYTEGFGLSSGSTDASSSTYGGTTPLSEPESQYVDRVLSENSDAVAFISCHSNQRKYETIWGSCATLYINNIAIKVIDKLSRAWRQKYDYLTNSPDTYLGSSEQSAPMGSESQQALRYGIQGATVEVSDYFGQLSETESLTSQVISRGTETYINIFSTLLGNFSYTDKKLI